MTITLPPDVAEVLEMHSRRLNVPVEFMVADVLRSRFVVPPFEPRDEWERAVEAIGPKAPARYLPDAALAREAMYE